MLGKLNTHEFAFGALTTSPHFGPARNPWSPDRVCGGSSGGSGAAVAGRPGCRARSARTRPARSGSPPASAASPGCVRRPGLVPNDGVVPTSWTFDTVGPIARSAEDCSLLLEALAPSYRPELDGGVGGLRVGVVEQLFERAEPDDRGVRRGRRSTSSARSARTSSRSTVPLLEEAGTIVQAIMLPEATQAHLDVAAHAASRLRGGCPRATARRAAPCPRPPT